MPVDAAASSRSVPDLQRRIDELSGELRARTADHEEALQREAAVAEILQVTNASAGDLKQVFNAMIEKATRLCSAAYGYIWLYDGQQITAVAAQAEQQFSEWLLHERGRVVPQQGSPLARVQLDHRLVHVVDAREDPAYHNIPRFRELIDRGGVRTLLHVPLRKEKDLLGVITVYRQECRPFSDAEIRLLEAFGEQAVIAIENARLIAETREALERQKATSEVLGVISSSPEELEPVFRSILSNAVALCRADLGNLFLYDGNAFRVAAMHGASPAYEEAWRRDPVLTVADHADVPLARLAATKQVVHIHDLAPERSQLERDPRYMALFEAARARSMLLMPMLKDDDLIGAIVIYTSEVQPFDDKHIGLVVNFARQAVIAIENSRLLKQLRDRTRDLAESFEYQGATSEVLSVISRSPTDTRPVFEAIAESTARLCQVEFCHVFRFDGELIHFMASYGHTPEATEGRSGTCIQRLPADGAARRGPS